VPVPVPIRRTQMNFDISGPYGFIDPNPCIEEIGTGMHIPIPQSKDFEAFSGCCLQTGKVKQAKPPQLVKELLFQSCTF